MLLSKDNNINSKTLLSINILLEVINKADKKKTQTTKSVLFN